ncbi:MAG: DUF2207 domain-containing protein, partial [Microcoleus sp. CSU_2_2]|nr:DUF2207 domain-containing protein [Microcoleus sp. CSU_2_2]
MNKRQLKKILYFFTTLLTIFLVTVTHVVAQQLPFYWENINVLIDVQTNGDMLVTETQKYVFTGDYNTERYRYIPLGKVDEIKDITVAENNQTIASTTGIENNQLWIRWQHQLKAPESHTFVIKYRVVGGLQLDGANTLVYWKAISSGRKAPINAAKVTVKLPEALSGKVLSFTNFGAAAVPRQVDPKTFEFVASQPVQPQQELEVQIAFPQPIINVPQSRWQQIGSQSQPSSEEQVFFDSQPFVMSFMWLIWVSVPILVIVSITTNAVKNRSCPECQTLKLKRTYKVLLKPTYTSAGKQEVTCKCRNCSYHHKYEVVMPILSYNSGGGGGGGGGGG